MLCRTLLALTSATLTLEDESLSIITTTATPSVTTLSTVSMKLSDALLLSSSSSQSTTASSISSSSQSLSSSSSSSSFSSSSSTLSLTGKQAIRKISNEEFPSDLVLHVEMEDKATQFLAWRIADASVQTESWETDIILNKLQASLMENQSTFQRLAHENNVLKQSLIEEKTESGWLRLAAQQAEAKTYVETETQSVPQCLSAVTQTEIHRLDAKREAEFSRRFYKAELSESTSIKWIHKPRSRSAGTVCSTRQVHDVFSQTSGQRLYEYILMTTQPQSQKGMHRLRLIGVCQNYLSQLS